MPPGAGDVHRLGTRRCVKEFVVVEQGIGLELVLNLPLPETVCGELALDGMERLKGDEHTER